MFRKLSKKQWLFVFSIWTLVAVFFTTNSYINVADDDMHNDYPRLLLFNATWYLWGLATPIILALIDHFPFFTKSWIRSWAAHIAAGIVILLVLSNSRVVLSSFVWHYFDLSTITWTEYQPYVVNRFVNNIPFYVLMVAILTALRAHQNRQELALSQAKVELQNQELQNQLNEAQLMALRLQLSPHFLFNTLNTINSLVDQGMKSEAMAMTTNLGEFLRRALVYEKKQFIVFEKELEFFELYINIERERFKDRLTVEVEVSEEANYVVVPNLILQPLVENAIKHGIAKNNDAKKIRLSAEVRSGQLVIQLFNEGQLGHSGDKSSGTGIGLKNVEERLAKIYGENASFVLSSNGKAGGVAAEINIPTKTTIGNEKL